MKPLKIGVLGATGAVGREMIKVLEDRKFPVEELRILASARSVGKEIPFCGKVYTIQEAKDTSFEGLDIVLGAVENDLAVKFAPAIQKSGAVFIDNSSAFRLNDDVPLVVPEINPEDALKHHGIIANPNCLTIITLVAINAIHKLSPIRSMIVSSYQAVSGAGQGGLLELEEETEAIANGNPVTPKIFPYQIAENLIPQIGDFLDNDYTKEEMKLQNEGRKILHTPDLKVTCTCVRVPVLRSHSVSAVVYTDHPLEPTKVQAAIAKAPGCRLVDLPKSQRYPMPLDTSGGDDVYVGRIRKDLTKNTGISLWCCGDQLRKGAAQNAVQIAELLLK